MPIKLLIISGAKKNRQNIKTPPTILKIVINCSDGAWPVTISYIVIKTDEPSSGWKGRILITVRTKAIIFSSSTKKANIPIAGTNDIAIEHTMNVSKLTRTPALWISRR